MYFRVFSPTFNPSDLNRPPKKDTHPHHWGPGSNGSTGSWHLKGSLQRNPGCIQWPLELCASESQTVQPPNVTRPVFLTKNEKRKHGSDRKEPLVCSQHNKKKRDWWAQGKVEVIGEQTKKIDDNSGWFTSSNLSRLLSYKQPQVCDDTSETSQIWEPFKSSDVAFNCELR